MSRRYIQSIVLILLVSLCVAHIRAQQPASVANCARPEFKLFLPLLGNWKVQWTDRTAPGKYAETIATARIEKDPIGCMLVEHFFGKRNGRSFTAVALLNFGTAEKLQRIFIDSEHGQILSFEGTKDGDTIRFEWQRDLGARRLMLKQDYRAIRDDSFTAETLLSTDNGKTWEIVQRAKYQRQPEPQSLLHDTP